MMRILKMSFSALSSLKMHSSSPANSWLILSATCSMVRFLSTMRRRSSSMRSTNLDSRCTTSGSSGIS